MFLFKYSRAVACGVLLLGTLPWTAGAATFFGVGANQTVAGAASQSGSDSVPSASFPAPVSVDIFASASDSPNYFGPGHTPITSFETASATAAGSVSAGKIKMLLTTLASRGPVDANNPYAASAQSQLDLYWSDSIKMTGPVGLHWTGKWHFFIHGDSSCTGTTTGSLSGNVHVGGTGGGSQFLTGNCGGIPLVVHDFAVSGTVGDTYTVDGHVSIATSANTGFAATAGTTFDLNDFGNGYELTFTVLTPGVGFTSGSGSSYLSAAAPEPSSYGFTLLGLAGVALARLRRGGRTVPGLRGPTRSGDPTA